jgi:hypothetical protein
MALSGAAGGTLSGGVLSRLSPQASLAARMAGGVTGGLVSGGTHAAMNVMQGWPWHEGVGTAVAVGLATGLVDGTMDYYGDRFMAARGTGNADCTGNSFVAGTLVATLARQPARKRSASDAGTNRLDRRPPLSFQLPHWTSPAFQADGR